MKRIAALLLAMVVGVSAQMFGTDPYSGSQGRASFDFTVVDTDIDASYELVSEGVTSFTQMVADSTPSLRYITQTISVAGADTIETDSTFHVFERAWLDSGMAAATIVFSRMASATHPTTSMVDSISLNEFVNPVAHLIFGSNDSPRLERVHLSTFNTDGTKGIRYEVRVFTQLRADLLYTQDYYVADYAYVRPEAGDVILEFGNYGSKGLLLPSPCAVAVYAIADAANSTGKVRLVGSRKAR